LADIERMADHIAILDYSVLRAQCSLETFRSCVQLFVLTFLDKPPALPPFRGLIQAIPRGNRLRLTLVNVTAETRAALARLQPATMEEAAISLEDAFVSYLGGSMEAARGEDAMQGKLAGGVS
jgi:ABC-2 type transport system ATP-binding protein